MKPVPTTTIKVILRSHDHGNPGRRAKGISHAELRAFCSEFATPKVPMNVPTRPIASAIPVWFSRSMCPSSRLTAGYWSTAFSTVCFSPGLSFSTMSSTVTRTSSSGKIATRAE